MIKSCFEFVNLQMKKMHKQTVRLSGYYYDRINRLNIKLSRNVHILKTAENIKKMPFSD